MNLYDKSVKEKSIKVKEDNIQRPRDSTSCLLEVMANEEAGEKNSESTSGLGSYAKVAAAPQITTMTEQEENDQTLRPPDHMKKKHKDRRKALFVGRESNS